MLAIHFFLPESLSKKDREQMVKKSRSAIDPRDLLEALRRPIFGPLLQTRFFYGFAWAIFTGTFGLFAQYSLNLESNETGYLLGYVGLLVVLVQGVAIGRLTARFSEPSLILSSVIIASLGLLGWAFVPNVPVLLVVLAPLAYASGVLNTVINSAITKAVPPQEVGGALGLAGALESLTRVISPIVGGYTLEKLGNWSPGVIAAAVLAWLAFYFWRMLRVRPDAAGVAI